MTYNQFERCAVGGCRNTNNSTSPKYQIPEPSLKTHYFGSFHLFILQNNSTAAPSTSGEFTGDGTAYSETVNDGTGFACSYRFLNPWARSYFAAMNAAQWDDGMSCGKCVKVRCTDSKCTKHDPVTLYIVDKVRSLQSK